MKYVDTIKENNLTLPSAFIDVDAFDQNLRRIADSLSVEERKHFTVRIATKSIRVVDLIRRALEFGAPFKGLMCYSAQEAQDLSAQGFDDFLVAYPTALASDLAALCELHRAQKKVSIVVDCAQHLEALERALSIPGKTGSVQGTKPFKVLVDIDLSVRFFGQVLGVRRSPLREVSQVIKFIRTLSNYKNLQFAGFMAYEAQVAGVGDQNRFKKLLSLFLSPFRKWSMRQVKKKRHEILSACQRAGIAVEIFNGGGTGTLTWHQDEVNTLTEVTVGSGLLASHLFDYYSNFKLQPAAFFALQAVRSSEPGWVTCAGGGYIASGEPGPDRLPLPLEKEFSLSALEAAGEVQTPIYVGERADGSTAVSIGEPVIFRPSKAGEWLERFNEVQWIEKGKITRRSLTYRGQGRCYF